MLTPEPDYGDLVRRCYCGGLCPHCNGRGWYYVFRLPDGSVEEEWRERKTLEALARSKEEWVESAFRPKLILEKIVFVS